MLDGDFSAVLLAQKRAYNRPLLLPQSMSRNVVGNGEENKRMKGDLEAGI